MTNRETEFMQISIDTDSKESFESGTTLITVRCRLDNRVTYTPGNIQLLIDGFKAAVEPFSDHARPIDLA